MQTNKTTLISTIILVLIIAGAGYYWYTQQAKEPADQTSDQPQTQTDTERLFSLTNYDETIDPSAEEELRSRFAIFKQRVLENEQDIESWAKMGIIKKSFFDFDGAEEIWLHATEINPSNIFTYTNLADLYHYFKRDPEKAKANYKLAIQNDPFNEQLYIEYARLLFGVLDDANLAETVLQDGIEIITEPFGVRVALADLYEQQGKIDLAIEQIEILTQEYPDNQAVLEELDRLRNLE